LRRPNRTKLTYANPLLALQGESHMGTSCEDTSARTRHRRFMPFLRTFGPYFFTDGPFSIIFPKQEIVIGSPYAKSAAPCFYRGGATKYKCDFASKFNEQNHGVGFSANQQDGGNVMMHHADPARGPRSGHMRPLGTPNDRRRSGGARLPGASAR